MHTPAQRWGVCYNHRMAHARMHSRTARVTRFVAMGLALTLAVAALRGVSVPHPTNPDAIAAMSDWWLGCVPFALLLGCMVVLPLVPATEHWWESNLSKLAVSAAMGLAALVWLHLRAGSDNAIGSAGHAIAEFVPFIVLLLVLYVISGGVRLEGHIPGTTGANTLLLGLGAVLANLLGTTGASMLLIRPLLRANAQRRHRVHTVVFFIFLVSNVGGCLLPIGDPPLFLGFLRGVPFTWTLSLWKPWVFTVGTLLALYASMDAALQRREPGPRSTAGAHVRVIGWWHLLLLGLAATVVATVQPGRPMPLLDWTPPHLFRELLLLALAAASFDPRPSRRAGRVALSMAPMAEVAALFCGIFMAMQVPLAVLEVRGASLGMDAPWKLFWSAGLLSSVLDNAPTYVVFMEVARGVTPQAAMDGSVALADGAWIRGDLLSGVSLGAVFMGAMTYIGNGPNLMVRAIAKHEGVPMPGFLGYVVWAALLLLPVMTAVSLLFL